MPNNRVYVLGILLFLTGLAVPEYGQGRIAQKPEGSVSATVPLDPAMTHLAPQYQGVDPRVIYNELERRSKLIKGEFETTAEFNARMARVQAAPLIGTVMKDSTIPFTLANGETMLDKVTTRYDADNGVLAVSIEMSAPIIGVEMDTDKRSLPLKYDFEASSSYVGQNAFGARVIIKKTFANIFELLIDNYRDYERVRPDSPVTFHHTITAKLEMTPAEAMGAKPTLKVLALVTLRDPYILEGYISHKPTVSEPRDTFAVYKYLVAELREFWIYDYASGRVYAKWRP